MNRSATSDSWPISRPRSFQKRRQRWICFLKHERNCDFFGQKGSPGTIDRLWDDFSSRLSVFNIRSLSKSTKSNRELRTGVSQIFIPLHMWMLLFTFWRIGNDRQTLSCIYEALLSRKVKNIMYFQNFCRCNLAWVYKKKLREPFESTYRHDQIEFLAWIFF